ncbi:MAG: HD domain-containing protein [Clostridia bacterium]|nr:HD domain-containing protein [Clostridia bacterium]MBQ3870682.1 HD domain-containing protein [Clostridia bacterium]
MIYTPLTKKAMKICYEAHQGQLDLDGLPYVFHPFHLAEQMKDENTTAAALLHDVIEDTSYTFDDLRKAGITERVLEIVALLTHDESVPYMDYIAAMKHDPDAKAIKLADLAHNSDPDRHAPASKEDFERNAKYVIARKLLTD